MPYRHTLIFDDSLNMLWKDYADRAVVDYRYNSSVKGSAQGCAAAMRVDLQVNAHAMHHTSACACTMHHIACACAVHAPCMMLMLMLMHAMRIGRQAGGSLRLHTDLAFRSDHAALSVQFWVRGLSAQFDGSRCDAPGAAWRYVRPARPSGWNCAGAVCLALWRSWGGQPAVQMVPLCSLAQVDRHGWHKVSVPASAFASSFGEAFDEVTSRRLEPLWN